MAAVGGFPFEAAAEATVWYLKPFDAVLTKMGLENWKDLVWENAGVLSIALVVFLLLPVILSLLPGGKKKGFLKPDEFQDLPLVERKELNHNTRWFRFALPKEDMPAGLPLGQHISLRLFDDAGKEVSRSYTPVSGTNQLGFVDFVIKIYPTGEMTQLLDKLKVGDKVGFKGPKGRMEYKRNMKTAIGMIAGGTGVTPMYQVMKAILEDPKDTTQLHLIFANVTESDILLKDELDGLVAAHKGRLSVYYVLNDCPPGWKGGSGFVNAEMIQQQLPAPGDDVMIWRCGPPPMNAAVKKALEGIGYSKESMFQF